MPKSDDNNFERRANHLLRVLQFCGGCVPLHRLQFQFSDSVIQTLLDLDEKPGVCRTLSNQLLRSGTSIGANVREAQSAQSNKDFLRKLEIALKEERETEYWLEILIEADLVEKAKFESLLQETRKIGKILVTSTRKIKDKINKLN